METAIKLPRHIKKGLKKAFFAQKGLTKKKIWKSKELKIINAKKGITQRGNFYVQFKGYTLTHSTLGY